MCDCVFLCARTCECVVRRGGHASCCGVNLLSQWTAKFQTIRSAGRSPLMVTWRLFPWHLGPTSGVSESCWWAWRSPLQLKSRQHTNTLIILNDHVTTGSRSFTSIYIRYIFTPRIQDTDSSFIHLFFTSSIQYIYINTMSCFNRPKKKTMCVKMDGREWKKCTMSCEVRAMIL